MHATGYFLLRNSRELHICQLHFCLQLIRIDSMDEAFFERVLRQGLDDDTITRVTIKDKRPAVGKGENFLSQLWRLTLEYFCNETDDESGNLINKNIKLIVKIEPSEAGAGMDLIRAQNIFKTEINVFSFVLPEIERIFEKRLSPKLFYCSKNPDTIVLEDLAVLGFKSKDRQLGLSMNHMSMALEAMAKFHAGSVYQWERNPNVIKSFTEGMITKKTPEAFVEILRQTLQMVSEKIRCWPDLTYSRIADKLDVMKQKFAEKILKVTDYDDTEFCVLNHGDCWINNMMFREDAHGKPLEIVLIDYQLSVYTSPAYDLIYFLSVCPEIDLHTSENDYFIEKYLRALSKSMMLLKCKTRPPTFEQLEKSMLKRRMWAVLAAITLYPRMIADASETESFDELLGSGVTHMDIFKNPDATKVMKKILPIMEKKGFFD